MAEQKTWSEAPWEPGERCGDCGCRIDEDLTCRCEHTLRTRIGELCGKLDDSTAELSRLRARVAELLSALVRWRLATRAGSPEGTDGDDGFGLFLAQVAAADELIAARTRGRRGLRDLHGDRKEEEVK